MGLVDYGSSGEESEAEEDEVPEAAAVKELPKATTKEPPEATAKELSEATAEELPEATAVKELPEATRKELPKTGDDEDELKEEVTANKGPKHGQGFVALPRPNNPISQDIAWSYLDKGKIKIYAPALPEPADEPLPSEERKRLKPSKKGCGLFALLPTPKNQFVVPIKRPAPKKPLPPPKKRPAVVSKPEQVSDESDGEDGCMDFFSLAGSESPPPEPVPDDIFNITAPEVGPKALPRPPVGSPVPEPPPSPADCPIQPLLDTAAISALCGGNPHRRSAQLRSEVEIIDVSQSSLVADPQEWLTKELSREQTTKSHRKGKRDSEPTSQQRRKHQITYLAFQAKEQELELKNQWANNRMTRKQTQAKYGF